MQGEPGTRERLIEAALHLIAERGYDGTSVGDIEAEAGLAPRSGALYKYFDSKLSLLEAALERHLASVERAEIDLTAMPLQDPKTAAELLGRWLLDEMDRERAITHVIEREGARIPDLRDRMRAGISDRGYRAASAVLARWSHHAPVETDDHDARAVLLVGSLVNFRRSSWTFGAPPLELDDERIVSAFAAMVVAVAGRPHQS